jgi:hypothetical protein
LSTRSSCERALTAGFGPPFFALVGIVGLLCAAASHAQECRESPRMHALDFWLGQWDVSQDGQLVGTNTIEATLDGCAIFEQWRDATGGKGTSLFYYDRGAARWKQVWVTEHALAVGGTHEREDRATCFHCERPGPIPGAVSGCRSRYDDHGPHDVDSSGGRLGATGHRDLEGCGTNVAHGL